MNQILKIEQFIPFLLRDELFFKHNNLMNGFVQLKALACNFGTFFVAEDWVEQGHDAQAGEDVFTCAFGVGGDADDAFVAQGDHGVVHCFD